MDESGDDGANTTRSCWFCQSCIALPMSEWHRADKAILEFRRYLKQEIGLGVRREIHASEIDQNTGSFSRPQLGRVMNEAERYKLLGDILQFINAELPVKIMNCYIDKRSYLANKSVVCGKLSPEIREIAIDRILNRFRVMWYKEESSNQAVIIHDDGAEGGVRRVVRKLRSFNWITNPATSLRVNMPLDFILEDPMFQASKHNRFLQLADVVCYALRGQFQRFGRLRRMPQHELLARLDNVIIKQASKHPLGIIEVK